VLERRRDAPGGGPATEKSWSTVWGAPRLARRCGGGHLHRDLRRDARFAFPANEIWRGARAVASGAQGTTMHTVSESVLQRGSERLAESAFLGGPARDFERIGRHCLEVLLGEGLTTSSKVLDVGCGALRAGYWLMRLLDPGHYFGIEPNREMLRLGLEQLVEPDVATRADARFAHNDDFDFSGFGESFDFTVARSIWTHASRDQIAAMLASFADTASANGLLLASYLPASAIARHRGGWQPTVQRCATRLPLDRLTPILARLPRTRVRGYTGTGWVGRSHESGSRGTVRHGLPWLTASAREHGLRLELTSHRVLNGQYWVRVRRAQ
jgi:SAM-dependent methyltransferase